MMAKSIKVNGRVQGVWFRASTKQEADRLGLSGFVRNESDGSVYIEVEGSEAKLKEFLNWCQVGPPIARVDQCEIEEISPKGFHNFAIRR